MKKVRAMRVAIILLLIAISAAAVSQCDGRGLQVVDKQVDN
jgi:hypothetical protein